MENLKQEERTARNYLAARHSVPCKNLDYIGYTLWDNYRLHQFNINQLGHQLHRSTVAYKVMEEDHENQES